MAKGKRRGRRGGGGGGGGAQRPSRRNGRKGSVLPIIAAVLATVIIGIILLSLYGERLFAPSPAPGRKAGEEKREAEAKTREVTLYFSDQEGLYLAPEKRLIKRGDLGAEISEAVTELIKGPAGTLGATIPEGTRLLDVEIKGGMAYLDFSPEMVRRHTGGSTGEIQTIYSIVNTVALNFPEIKEVQILIGGRVEKTLSGHIDISHPLWADKLVIKG